jgi:hypothetical protein
VFETEIIGLLSYMIHYHINRTDTQSNLFKESATALITHFSATEQNYMVINALMKGDLIETLSKLLTMD